MRFVVDSTVPCPVSNCHVLHEVVSGNQTWLAVKSTIHEQVQKHHQTTAPIVEVWSINTQAMIFPVWYSNIVIEIHIYFGKTSTNGPYSIAMFSCRARCFFRLQPPMAGSTDALRSWSRRPMSLLENMLRGGASCDILSCRCRQNVSFWSSNHHRHFKKWFLNRSSIVICLILKQHRRFEQYLLHELYNNMLNRFR